MNKLNHKDELQMATHSGIIETKILSDYLEDLESLVVEFENERTSESMHVLAYEATRFITHLVYLNNNVLSKLIQIEELTSIDVDVEEA
ncbi:hypothetical protein PML80_04230 [Aerococcus urinaeequi]|uniref:Uncharacterized protein n=1 Tax=Aerococcus urinaeequi TaxID=51665 RepID=A0AAE9XNH2_9LACT|nr:hypothetical protein [Aerococcus urinaeequi]WCG38541.1 hypothetical protein PML80_04230 [Aerococcus urinaeequi]